MTSAAIYARVSSARQKKDETIGSQTAALREHAAQNRLEVPEEWVFEDEGHSGATLVRPGLEALRDLAAQGCLDVVLVYSPDRLARKFAYQALLLEEFAWAGVRREFVTNGARGDSPEDQLLVQFQGMFAEYEKAQLMERYRRGKAHRARTGSVNVLSGAPFGYRYQRKTDLAGAVYEIIEHEAALVAELFRRYADEGASIADLARWLTGQGVPTRTGKHRWDRSVIWGMLRNPAYAGTAVFGKTMAIHEPAGLNHVARLQGRSTPRAIKTVDRPREEWTQIPVPAIVDQDTFARVQQRLADNKRFAARNTKVPSLLQGLAACTACGYGYYRTSTTTTNKKIYYYRCLGSDDYRYEGGRVCRNQPVRADYLDTVVWDHITGLLADPALIHAEIDKRLDQARTSDPARSQRKRLETALAKATTSISAMIEALAEQLITIDELRARMPHLRAREASLRSQIDALDAQAADRDAYLKLADDIEGFLSRLRTSAGTARTEERQKVLRLLVKDVLIGPEKITIRHRIPVRDTNPAAGQRATELDTEGDHRPGYPLRWGRDCAPSGGMTMSLQDFVPTPRFEEYRETFRDFYRMERRDDGVLRVAADTLGGPVQLSVQNHRSLGQMLKTVGADPDNEVLILTGSGEEFMMAPDPEGFALEEADMEHWAYEYAYKDGRINVSALVNDVEIPTIGVLNGPGFHSEIVLMCDITLAAEDAVIFDLHYDIGSVPADGIHNAFQELLGVKRAAYALLTGEAISARQALEWGMVNEVVPRDQLIPRAYQIADHIMTQPRTVRRLTTQIVRRPWKQRIVSDLDGGFGIQMFGHIAKKRAVHGEQHIRSTVDYVREGRKNNFD